MGKRNLFVGELFHFAIQLQKRAPFVKRQRRATILWWVDVPLSPNSRTRLERMANVGGLWGDGCLSTAVSEPGRGEVVEYTPLPPHE